MHSATLTRLQQFEDSAQDAGLPRRYLRLLSPFHFQWHSVARRVGFLLFHWHCIDHFRNLGLDQAMDVEAYRAADFEPGGQFAGAGWSEPMGGLGNATSLQELADYSTAIEGWHNEAHMIIGDATGLDMMDARANVFFPEFWRLHFFINERFEEQLVSYGDSVHPGTGAAAELVAHIESQHPAAVARV